MTLTLHFADKNDLPDAQSLLTTTQHKLGATRCRLASKRYRLRSRTISSSPVSQTIPSALVRAVTFQSGAGDDIISAGAGDDIILAGAGDDTVNADAGDDVIVRRHRQRHTWAAQATTCTSSGVATEGHCVRPLDGYQDDDRDDHACRPDCSELHLYEPVPTPTITVTEYID
jgi:hypothetical protein